MMDDAAGLRQNMVACVTLRDLSAKASAQWLEDVLGSLEGRSTVVIDCAGLSDLAAETLSTLVRAGRRRDIGQPKMVLRGASVYVRTLFEECGLGRIFEIE